MARDGVDFFRAGGGLETVIGLDFEYDDDSDDRFRIVRGVMCSTRY